MIIVKYILLIMHFFVRWERVESDALSLILRNIHKYLNKCGFVDVRVSNEFEKTLSSPKNTCATCLQIHCTLNIYFYRVVE